MMAALGKAVIYDEPLARKIILETHIAYNLHVAAVSSEPLSVIGDFFRCRNFLRERRYLAPPPLVAFEKACR